MIVFVLVAAQDEAALERRIAFGRRLGATLVPFEAGEPIVWSPSASMRPLAVIAWPEKPVPNDPEIIQVSDVGVRIEIGWRHKSRFGEVGEYLLLTLDNAGNGEFRRNLTGIYSIYCAQENDVCVLSNRASLAAAIFQESLNIHYDSNYLATCIGLGWAHFDRTLFSGVRCLEAGCEPVVTQGRVVIASPTADRWFDQEFFDRYGRNPGGFWTDRLAELDDVLTLFFDARGNSHFKRFALSGGKDSRLLFALLRRKHEFSSVELLTHGSPTHHDVVIASHIADRYNMRHSVMDSVYQRMDLDRMLPDHLFISEGRGSPYDFATWRPRKGPGLNIYGHELGLREPIPSTGSNPAPEALFSDLRRFHGQFDQAELLTEDARISVEKLAWTVLEKISVGTKSKDNILWRFYTENRILHLVSLIKSKDDAQRLSPYVFMTDRMLRSAYAIGRQARVEERIHYELLRRIDPWLTFDCPFADQKWPLSLREKEGPIVKYALPFPSYSSGRVPAKGSYAAFRQKKMEYRDFVLDNISNLSGLVNRSGVERAFSKDKWRTEEIQCIWFLVMAIGLKSLDWGKLSPMSRTRDVTTFPKLVYSNEVDVVPLNSTTSAESALILNQIYLDAVPEAVYALSRTALARQCLRDADGSWYGEHKVEGIMLYSAAAALGDPRGMFVVGKALIEGDALQQNFDAGLMFVEEARRRGLGTASSFLARVYDDGKFVVRDPEKALTLSLEAVEHGDFWSLERVCRLKEAAKLNAQLDWIRLEVFLSERVLQHDDAHARFLIDKIRTEGKIRAIHSALALKASQPSAASGLEDATRRIVDDGV
jgi:hypothetical protein